MKKKAKPTALELDLNRRLKGGQRPDPLGAVQQNLSLATPAEIADGKKLREITSKLDFCSNLLTRKAGSSADLKKAAKLVAQASELVDTYIIDLMGEDGV